MPTAKFDSLIREYGDLEIQRGRVVRKPLFGSTTEKFLQSVLGVGKVEHHDKYYHLFQELHLKNPNTGESQVVMIERNHTLKAIASRAGGLSGLEQGMKIEGLDKKNLSFGQYVQNSRDIHEKTGRSFTRYSLDKNNCQDFTEMTLRANGLYSDEMDEFVNQNAEALLPGWIKKLTQGVTDLAARVDDGGNYILPAESYVSRKSHHHHTQHYLKDAPFKGPAIEQHVFARQPIISSV